MILVAPFEDSKFDIMMKRVRFFVGISIWGIIITYSYLCNAQSNASFEYNYNMYSKSWDRFVTTNDNDSLIITLNNFNKYLSDNFPNEEWRKLPQNTSLILTYSDLGNYTLAKAKAIENLDILNKFNDTSSNGYAYNLVLLGNLQLVLNENHESRKTFLIAEEIFKKNKDSTSLTFAKFLNSKGKTENYFSNYKESVILFSKANSIVENSLKNRDDGDFDFYVANVNDLSLSLEGLGDFNKSLDFKLKLANILRENGRVNSYEYLQNHYNLSVSYIKLDKLLEAEKYLFEGFELVKKNNSSISLRRKYLEGFSILYRVMGDYKKSQYYSDEALKLFSFNSNDLNSYNTLFLNANQLQSEGKFLEALKINKLILEEIQKNKLPKGAEYLRSISVAVFLSGLLDNSPISIDDRKMLISIDDRKKLLLESSEITLKLFGYVSYENAKLNNDFGDFFYYDLYDYKEAIESYERAIKIYESLITSGKGYKYNIIGCYLSVSRAYEKVNELKNSYSYLIKANKMRFNSLNDLLPFISESERDNFVLDNQEEFSALKSFIWRNSDKLDSNVFIGDLLILENYYGGLSINTSKQIRRALDELPANLREEYNLILEQDLTLNSEDMEKRSVNRALQKKLSSTLNINKIENVYPIIVNKSNFEGAVVLFQRFLYANRNIYSCVILSKDKTVRLYLPLFQEAYLDSVLSNSSQSGKTLISLINEFYSNRGSGVFKTYINDLFNQLTKFKKIHIITSGKLNFINFGAFEMENGMLFGENHEISYYNNLNDFISEENSNSKLEFEEVDIFAGLNYNSKQERKSNNKNEIGDVSTIRNFSKFSNSLRSFNNTWSYLPGSKSEGISIKKIFDETTNHNYQVKMFEDNFGDEQSFRLNISNNSRNKIVHLSTHGFFFDKLEILINRDSTFRSNKNNIAFRSGLILSGGNTGWKNFEVNKSNNDGILTSFEISKFNLTNVKLLVLSACDTGLGDIQSDEGVFGLQRAFKLAGVNKIILSLWKVPDMQTKELMTYFYESLTNGKSINSSLSIAQSKMKAKYSAFYWAAFKLLN